MSLRQRAARHPARDLPAGLGKRVYAGGIAQIGNAWAATNAISLSDTHHGFTAIAGLDTLVGPIFLAYGLGEGGRSRFYLTVGRSF